MPKNLFVKGVSGNPKGKPVGAGNKANKIVKDVFASVFSDLQDHPKAKLKEWAIKNPTEFYKLSSKLIPIQLGSDPENPLPPIIQIVRDNGNTAGKTI